jgi:hypothetical protein
MNKNPARIVPLLLAVALFAFTQLALAAEGHRLILQVNDNDPARMNLVLNNASNIIAYYQDKGEPIEVEIVAYGPGLHMLRADTSPIAQRVASFSDSFDNVSFAACGNTMKGMGKKEGKTIELLPQAKVVPAGVVRILELQEQGWSYVKP